MERPTANARSAATLRMRPGRYSTIGIPSALGEDGPSPSDFPSGFEKTPKPNQQSVRGVSFCASPRAPSEKPAEQLTEKEKIADAVSQIALTVPQRRESLSGIASPRRTEASASTPPPTSEKKAPVIPPKPRIDWTTRGPPPPGSLGPKIPRPEDVNPDLRARNKAATELKSTIGMTAIDIQGTIRAHNAKMQVESKIEIFGSFLPGLRIWRTRTYLGRSKMNNSNSRFTCADRNSGKINGSSRKKKNARRHKRQFEKEVGNEIL